MLLSLSTPLLAARLLFLVAGALALVFEHGGNVGLFTLLVRSFAIIRRCHSSRPAVYMWIGTPVAHGVSPQLPPRYQACPGGPDQEVYAPRALWQALMRGDGRLLRRGLLFVSGQGTQGHLFQRHISVVAWYLPGGGER